MNKLFVFTVFFAGLFSACQKEPDCFSGPLLKNNQGLESQMTLSSKALTFGVERRDQFESDKMFSGYILASAARTKITIDLKADDSSVGVGLAIYGPREEDGLFGMPLVSLGSVKDSQVSINEFVLPEEGDYLVLVADLSESRGDYRLFVDCIEFCDPPQCLALICGKYCPAGYGVSKEDGCPICECKE
jgi:hypothetical protein